MSYFQYGAEERNRTSILAFSEPRRDQLGYLGLSRDWWVIQDSNLRPSGCKPDALTN